MQGGMCDEQLTCSSSSIPLGSHGLRSGSGLRFIPHTFPHFSLLFSVSHSITRHIAYKNPLTHSLTNTVIQFRPILNTKPYNLQAKQLRPALLQGLPQW